MLERITDFVRKWEKSKMVSCIWILNVMDDFAFQDLIEMEIGMRADVNHEPFLRHLSATAQSMYRKCKRE